MSGATDEPITAIDFGVMHVDYRAYLAQQAPPGDWSTWLILAGSSKPSCFVATQSQALLAKRLP